MVPAASAERPWYRRCQALLGAIACCALTATAAAQDASQPPASGSKPMPLVNADPDLAAHLNRIERLVAEKAHADAIRLLQDLIDKGEGFYENSTDGRRYVSMRLKAHELIGRMGAEGLDLYRQMTDAVAQKVYQDGLAAGDPVTLQRVVNRYLYSSFGPRALDALGAVYFDRAKFLQAAYCWQRLAAMNLPDSPAPLLAAKAAVAMHLGGDPAGAAKALDELQRKHPGASATIAGKPQDLAEFVSVVLKMPAMTVQVGREATSGFPGLGALGGGLWRSEDVDAVLSPRWRACPVEPGQRSTANLEKLLVAPDHLTSMNPRTGMQVTAELRDGQVRLRSQAGNQQYMYGNMPRTPEMLAAGMIHPVVSGELVIVRTKDCLVAYDLIDGNERWRSTPLPMVRQLAASSGSYYNPMMGARKPVDNGRYLVTLGGGMVFALADFRPPVNLNVGMMPGGGPGRKDDSLVDNSRLVGLSVASGKQIWRAGRGEGDDVVRNAKFLSAPTYAGGRLYVLAAYMENSFLLLCLEAQTGALAWKQLVSQAPLISMGGWGAQMGLDAFQVGTPPAVLDGRVFVLTNAGVLGAFDAQTGQPLWAYQYDSTLESLGRAMTGGVNPRSLQAAYGFNPILVTRGRVIVLPSDSERLMALGCEDGAPLWQVGRSGQSDLTSLDEDRVLLSGEGLSVLSVVNGQELHQAGDVSGVLGRPAVTDKAILVSSAGRLYRLEPDSWALKSVDLSDADGLLGNLVCVDGKLVAANAAGVCAYFRYEEARDRINQRLERASPKDRPELMMFRGQLAFNAGRFAEALTDFQACDDTARQLNDEGAVEKVRPALYRTHVALGNRAPDGGEMVSQFLKAASFGRTELENAQMKVRLAKAYERGGQLEQAAVAAQELADQFADAQLVDVPIGPEVDPRGRFSEQDPTVRGYVLGHRLVGQWIGAHGRAMYARFDQEAQAAFQKAQAASDVAALEAVKTRWPHAACAFDALFAAAEASHKAAQSAAGEAAQEHQRWAVRLLTEIYNEPASARNVAATAALATLYARGGRTNYAQILVERLRDMPADTPVAFADIQGGLGKLIADIDAGGGPRLAAPIEPVCAIDPPLRPVLSLTEADTFLLRDQNYAPVRLGESAAMLQGGRVVLADSGAKDAQQAVVWSGLSGVDPSRLRQTAGQQGVALVAGLSRDGKLLVVADRVSATALEVQSAKIKWQKRMSDLGLGNVTSVCVAEGVLVGVDAAGKIACADLSTGEARWQGALTASSGRSGGISGVPQIGGGVVAVVNMTKVLTCFDLNTGKLIGRWEGKVQADALISPAGLIVTLIDGEMAVRERSKVNEPLWTKSYAQQPQGQATTLLSVGAHAIVVCPSRGNTAEVLPIVGGGKVQATLKMSVASGGAIPSDAVMRDKAIYVVCSQGGVSPRHFGPNQRYLRNISLQKFSLDGGAAPVWVRALKTDGNTNAIVPPPQVTDRHVVLTARSQRADEPGSVMVLDAKDGKVIQEISLEGAGEAPGKTDPSRQVLIGPPIMTEGRLCVETQEGVTVYGK